MTWKTLLALVLPAALRTEIHDEFTRAVAANIHANRARRAASVRTALVADARAETMGATIHRIEGRSGDRLTDDPHVGDAALRVASGVRKFLERRR